jgi:hypothetical protein
MTLVKCIDCGAVEFSEHAAKVKGWGWSYGPEGTLWVCAIDLDEREFDA